MEFCGMKREIDRKCLIHARVHANAQSFDRCEARGEPEVVILGAEQKERGLWVREWFLPPISSNTSKLQLNREDTHPYPAYYPLLSIKISRFIL